MVLTNLYNPSPSINHTAAEPRHSSRVSFVYAITAFARSHSSHGYVLSVRALQVCETQVLLATCSYSICVAGKVHGSLARAGKVRGQTPKVAKQEKKKNPKGRAMKRIKYNRRFVNVGELPAALCSKNIASKCHSHSQLWGSH
jgi:small subunit ribosomal protein S30e